jgi:photosystem II stability/assembly factor-like uncharacterized protein
VSASPDQHPASHPSIALAADYLHGLRWRLIGPFRGGRVVAVAGDPVHPQVFYFGSTGGGVWKTTDGGQFWENVSDGYFKRASVGGLAVAPSDPNVLYAGMGEATIRGNVSHGDGLYRSTDAGKSWTHVGLGDTRQIAKVRVHPSDPDTVYVAALGHAHGPNADRGVFRSRDGGRTWQHVLARGEDVGAGDLALDPSNPRILYATTWRARRLPYVLQSGGDGCGIFQSTDGGDTWTELTRNKGLPSGTVGKIGVAVSPARPERVWAIVEAEDGGVYRSDDAGKTWQRVSEDRGLRLRPWYYMHIIADPSDPETVYVLNETAFRSVDGGKTFEKLPVPHGDNHDLWIDPRDSRRMIAGHDGGACVSFTGGDTWSDIYNQPTAEFYHVTTDEQVPYRVYGAQQDNTTMSLPSRSRNSAILAADAEEVGGGESGYIAVRADDPNIVYAGSYLGYLTRYDRRTGQRRNIMVWPESLGGTPASEARYRFQWTFPVLLSPHDPNTLYTAANHVFRSTDEGASWDEISPDLTRNDPTHLGPSGGPITKDNVGTEYYCTVFALAESPRERGLLWAGSDDGLVHLSRDGGANWQNVTPPELPEWALISIIEPSPHDAATAYLAATRYKLDDFAPYLYKTADYGRTWMRITGDLPADVFTRVIREDPERAGLLYCGTETGLYFSFDDGAHWHPLGAGLPVVPIHDLVVKGTDLIAATHGRSFWILDDIGPLRQMTTETPHEPLHLFAPRPAVRLWSDHESEAPREASPAKQYGFSNAWTVTYRTEEAPTGEIVERPLNAGQNPRDGVYIFYTLRERPADPVTLTILDGEGREIRTFTSEPPKAEQPRSDDSAEPMAPEQTLAEKATKKDEKKEPRVATEPGLNCFVWDMRYPEARKRAPREGVKDDEGRLAGPLAAPGQYAVRLTAGEHNATVPFEVHKDPRIAASDEDLVAQFQLALAIRDKVSETHDAINTVRSIRRQVEEWERRTKDSSQHERVAEAGKALNQRLAAIEQELTQVKALHPEETTLSQPVKLDGKLAALMGVVSGADAAPTRQARTVFDDLSRRLDEQLGTLRALVEREVADFNAMIRSIEAPAIVPHAGAEG